MHGKELLNGVMFVWWEGGAMTKAVGLGLVRVQFIASYVFRYICAINICTVRVVCKYPPNGRSVVGYIGCCTRVICDCVIDYIFFKYHLQFGMINHFVN